MNFILQNSPEIDYFTNMKLVFDSFGGIEKNYNWLITDVEINTVNDNAISLDYSKNIFIDGEKLSKIIFEEEIQFVWGVFSAFRKDIKIDINNLECEPYADCNPNLWILEPKIQHPLADIEIVCWDSSSTLLLSKNEEVCKLFKERFKSAMVLEDYNKKLFLK